MSVRDGQTINGGRGKNTLLVGERAVCYHSDGRVHILEKKKKTLYNVTVISKYWLPQLNEYYNKTDYTYKQEIHFHVQVTVHRHKFL